MRNLAFHKSNKENKHSVSWIITLHNIPFQKRQQQDKTTHKLNTFTCSSYAIKAMLISFKVLIYLAAEDRHSWLNTSSGHAVKIIYFKHCMPHKMLIQVCKLSMTSIHEHFSTQLPLKHMNELENPNNLHNPNSDTNVTLLTDIR